MKERAAAASIDEYIAGFPQDIQAMLQEMRTVIREAAPEASETISYAVPTFDLTGRHLMHFAAFKHHVGFYPTPGGIARFARELQPYKTAKGSVQFPFGQPMPVELIRRIVQFRVEEILAA